MVKLKIIISFTLDNGAFFNDTRKWSSILKTKNPTVEAHLVRSTIILLMPGLHNCKSETRIGVVEF